MRSVVLLVGILAAGCGGGEADPGRNSAPGRTAVDRTAPEQPTWTTDVAAIVHRSCAPCHRPGQSAPFSLLSYGDARKRSDQIVEVTEDGYMPPWLPTHGDFVGDRRLTAAEITTLRRWADNDAPRGDSGAEPPTPEFSDGWQLREPDLVLNVDETIEVAAAGPDRFRNFVIRIPGDRTRFVEAIEIQPRSAAVHHAVVAIDATSASRQQDAASSEPGFDGMVAGNAEPPDGYFLGWTPGKRVRPLSGGMAWRLVPGRDLVLQLHLTPTGRVETVRPRLGFFFTKTAPTVVSYPLTLFNDRIDLPAGAAGVTLTDEFTTPVPVRVHSIYPHAHYLCRRMRGTITLPGGVTRDLFRIDRWDFDWQDDYRFVEPVAVPAGATIAFEYEFDNSADNPQNPSRPPRRVTFGQESTDEMATLTLQVSTADPEGRRRLALANVRRDLAKVAFDVGLVVRETGILRELGRHDEALVVIEKAVTQAPADPRVLRELGLTFTNLGRPEDAERAFRACLAQDDGEDVARIELASLLARRGETGAAIGLFERALRTSPGQPTLHNNLATAYYSEGRLGDAERHYRQAIDLDENYFTPWFLLGRVLLDQGNMTGARAALQRARELKPGHPAVEQALQRLQ